MPRYVINVTSNGTRLFSTSRSSIGDDKQKLASLVSLFSIITEGAPEEEGMAMQVVRIADHAAETCTLDGTPLSQVPQPMGSNFAAPFGNAAGDFSLADARVAQVATLKNDGWHETADSKVTNDAMGLVCDNWNDAILEVFGETIGVATLKEEAHAVALTSAQIGEAKA